MSETSLVLVVRDGAGQRYERCELSACESIIVGRGWHCDIIVQDPQVDPEHVAVRLDEEGQLNCVDLNSLNGVQAFETTEGKRRAISGEPKPVRLVPEVPQSFSSGATLRLGKSQLLIYTADHEVAAAVEPSRWDAIRQLFERPLWVALGLVVLSVSALLGRLGESVEPLSAEMIVSVLSWETLGIGVWVLFWGLLTKLWRNTMHLRAHLSIAAFSGAVGYLLAQLSDLLGWQLQSVNAESLLVTLGMAGLLFVVLVLTLGVATRLRRQAILWVASVPGFLLLLSMYAVPLLGDEEVDWFPQLVTSSYPPGWQLPKGQALDSFLSSSPELYDRTAKQAEARAQELAGE